MGQNNARPMFLDKSSITTIFSLDEKIVPRPNVRFKNNYVFTSESEICVDGRTVRKVGLLPKQIVSPSGTRFERLFNVYELFTRVYTISIFRCYPHRLPTLSRGSVNRLVIFQNQCLSFEINNAVYCTCTQHNLLRILRVTAEKRTPGDTYRSGTSSFRERLIVTYRWLLSVIYRRQYFDYRYRITLRCHRTIWEKTFFFSGFFAVVLNSSYDNSNMMWSIRILKINTQSEANRSVDLTDVTRPIRSVLSDAFSRVRWEAK